MPTFDLQDALENNQVWIRRLQPDGSNVYDPLPYKIVQYDDGTKGIEGISDPHWSNLTHKDAGGLGTKPGFKIVDRPPYSGVSEID